MKLQKLTIKNLASIEDALIDFENGPLSEESLFLICGETGSGKTTILDAICLALYNETPRMDRTVGEKYKDTTQAFSSKKEDVLINDNRQLMRRNTCEAWAELEFLGTNDIAYTAKWYVARARKKADGTLQDVKWTLENRKTRLLLTKKTEIPNEIQAAVGLTFEQFCRTTLLAQGDFTKFLQSKESEKSDILEKLTGTGIYSEIGSRIYAITKEKRTCYEDQNRKIEGIPLLTDEDIAEANEQIATIGNEIRNFGLRKNSILQKRDWLKKKAELMLASEKRKKVWEEKKTLLLSEEFREKERLTNDWHTATDARNWLSLLNKSLTDKEREEARSLELQEEYMHLCKGQAWLTANTEKLRQKLLRVEEYLQKHAPLLPMFEQSQAVITDLQSILSSQTRTSRYEKEIEELNNKQPLRQQERETKEKAFLLRSKENSDKQQEIDQKKILLEAMGQSALQAKKLSLEADKEKLVKAQTALTLLKEKLQVLNMAEKNEQSLNDKITACQEQYNEVQTDFNRKKESYDELCKLYDKQKDSVEDWAKEARTRLSVGDTCPVCGQQVKSLCRDEDFQSILAPILASLSAKEKEYKEAEQALNNNRTEFKTYQKLTIDSRTATKKAQEGYDRALADAESKCKECRLQGISESTEEALKDLIQNNRLDLDHISRKLNEAQDLTNVISRLQQQKDGLQKAVEAARKELQAADKALEELKNGIANKRSLIKNETDTAQATLLRVGPSILWENWQPEWYAHPTSFIERLRQAAACYKTAQDEQAELTTAINFNRKELNSISTTRENICSAFPDWRNILTEESVEVKNPEIAWNSLSAETLSLKQNMSSTHNMIKELQSKLDAFRDSHPEFDETYLATLSACSNVQIEQLRTDLLRFKEEVATSETAYNLIAEQMEAHLKQQPETDEKDTIELLEEQIDMWEQKINEGNQTIGRLQGKLKQHEENAALIKDEKLRAEELRKIYLKWDRLCRYFGDEKGKNFRNIAQSFVLKELLYGANYYLQRLTNRYELECQAGSLTILLRDFYQGGTARPACTLSGGESFLVSLSLALGLSSLSRQSLSVDTLFIDEGFGTLSGDYLNTVMDTLEKLHQMGGKKVGIISHVEGLKERIKMQIQVKRVDNSRSEIQTVKTV